MNINHDIVARAFNKAGQEPLTADEWSAKNSVRYRIVYQFYLETILETLANTDWTSQKKKIALVESEEDNLSTYSHMYILPQDCAKAVSLMNDEIYMVEGPYLYTNQADAILTYITNGYTSTEQTGEDYTSYKAFNPDPMLAEYIETKLASKIVLKLSGDTQLYQLLYNEAMLTENKAIKASSAQGQNKDSGNPYWSDILGLPDYEEI